MHTEQWVEKQLASLEGEWSPNAANGWSRLESRRVAVSARRTRTMLAAGVVTAVLAGAMAFPAPRALAQRCLQCFVPAAAAPQVSMSARTAIDFTLTDADGKQFRLSDMRGKVVLLDFWATWCGGCKVEIPWFIEFESRYRDKGFAVVGVSLDEGGWAAVRPFIPGMKINYRVLLGNDALADQYKVEAMPKTLLIDRAGRIVAEHVGVASKDSFEKEIQKLLAVGSGF